MEDLLILAIDLAMEYAPYITMEDLLVNDGTPGSHICSTLDRAQLDLPSGRWREVVPHESAPGRVTKWWTDHG